MVLARDQSVAIFKKERSIDAVKIFLQQSSQLNHVYPDQLFLRQGHAN